MDILQFSAITFIIQIRIYFFEFRDASPAKTPAVRRGRCCHRSSTGSRGGGGRSAILQQRQRADGPALLLSSVHRVCWVPGRPQWAGEHRQRWRGGRPSAHRLIPRQPVQQHVYGLLGAAWPAERGSRRHRRGRGDAQASSAGVRAVTATAVDGHAKKKTRYNVPRPASVRLCTMHNDCIFAGRGTGRADDRPAAPSVALSGSTAPVPSAASRSDGRTRTVQARRPGEAAG